MLHGGRCLYPVSNDQVWESCDQQVQTKIVVFAEVIQVMKKCKKAKKTPME